MREGKQSFRRAQKAFIAERRARVAKLYRKGKTQASIARELGLSTFTVSADIQAMIAEWRRQAATDIRAHAEVQLEKLSAVEVEAWKGYKDSCQPKKKVSVARMSDACTKDYSTKIVSIAKIERPEGDPRFLRVILKSIEQQCKLWGLSAGEKEEEATHLRPRTLADFVASFHKRSPVKRKQRDQRHAEAAPTTKLDPNRLP